MRNIYNIDSNYHFFDSFLEWLSLNFADKISDVKIFFPNKRACHEFQNIFAKKFGAHIKIPKLKAIADIEKSDFLDSFPKAQIQDIINEVAQINRMEGFDYLFFLSHEIIKTKVFGENINFTQALNIAQQLKNLFDDIEREEIDLNLIYEIDDSDLAAHRQFTLEFLKKFYVRIKNSVLKKNIVSPVSFQNFIIIKLAQTIEQQGLKSPLIIAGSTGSVNSSKKLIKAIANDKNGFVVLYGLKEKQEEVDEVTAPQYLLSELLKFIKVVKKDVAKIAYEKFKICDNSRLDFIANAMLPSAQTYKWQEIKIDENLAQDFEKNFLFLEAKNEIEEARLIAIACAKSVLINKKTAIIANDLKFVSLIKSQLKNFSLEFNDSRSLDLSGSKLINLILLLFELLENDFESATLLAILKHPLSASSLDSENLKNFEINILREQRFSLNLQGILYKLKIQNEELQKFFDNFLLDIAELLNLDFEVDVAKFTKIIIAIIENISKKTWFELIDIEAAGEDIAQLFEKLQLQNNFHIKKSEILQFFSNLFSQINYFSTSDLKASIQILSTIEARLLNFDVIIVSSLNQGDFPQIEGENWLGQKIRHDLGIDLSPKKYGQNAYDFCNYLANKKVILTRTKTKNSTPLIASPFILRFAILCKKLGIKLNEGQEYFNLLEKLDGLEEAKNKALSVEAIFLKTPKAKLKKLSITEIPKLLNDPYQIYAKRILQLRELNKIDYEPEFREFGSFVHQALEEFIKNPKQENFIQKAKEIFIKYFANEEAKLIWWPKFENILQNFIKENKELEARSDYVEVPVNIFIKDVLISGKIDRISFFENDEAEIFDYKTGQIPATKDVTSGLQPQLTIYALMLCLGNIENKKLQNISQDKIKSLDYWKISATSESEIKQILKTKEEIAFAIAAAKIGLENLLCYFNEKNNSYHAALEPERHHEYSHLARIF